MTAVRQAVKIKTTRDQKWGKAGGTYVNASIIKLFHHQKFRA